MKILLTNYQFDPVNKTIRIYRPDDQRNLELERFLLITNTDTGSIIYNFAVPTLRASSLSADTLTLLYNTSSMSKTANLQIYYDDPDGGVEVVSEQLERHAEEQLDALTRILAELKTMNVLLSIGMNIPDRIDLISQDPEVLKDNT